jgi:hypothetical protein
MSWTVSRATLHRGSAVVLGVAVGIIGYQSLPLGIALLIVGGVIWLLTHESAKGVWTSGTHSRKFVVVLTSLALVFGLTAGTLIGRFVLSPAVNPLELVPAVLSLTTLAVHDDAERSLYMSSVVTGSTTAEKYGQHNYVVVFCRALDNTVDPGSDKTIDRSKRFDLENRVLQIEVPLSKETADRLYKRGSLDIYLTIIPKEVDEAELSTLKDVLAHGGKIVDHTRMTVPSGSLKTLQNK